MSMLKQILPQIRWFCCKLKFPENVKIFIGQEAFCYHPFVSNSAVVSIPLHPWHLPPGCSRFYLLPASKRLLAVRIQPRGPNSKTCVLVLFLYGSFDYFWFFFSPFSFLWFCFVLFCFLFLFISLGFFLVYTLFHGQLLWIYCQINAMSYIILA